MSPKGGRHEFTHPELIRNLLGAVRLQFPKRSVFARMTELIEHPEDVRIGQHPDHLAGLFSHHVQALHPGPAHVIQNRIEGVVHSAEQGRGNHDGIHGGGDGKAGIIPTQDIDLGNHPDCFTPLVVDQHRVALILNGVSDGLLDGGASTQATDEFAHRLSHGQTTESTPTVDDCHALLPLPVWP